MATISGVDFPYITDDQRATLLGNARPKTLADIEGDEYWGNIFQQWCSHNGYGAEHEAWVTNPKGAAREALKTHPDGDLRTKFYEDMGTVKAHQRKDELDSGDRARQLDANFDEMGF